jgi:acetylglutamate kinase
VETQNSVSIIFPKILNSINDTQKYINGLNVTNNSSIYNMNNQSATSKNNQMNQRFRTNNTENVKVFIFDGGLIFKKRGDF